MVNSYICMLESEEELIKDQIFNVGFENYSVEKLAIMVKEQIKDKVEIEYVKSNDDRSYHINSKKIERVLNFKPQKSIFQAISDLISAFDKKIFFNSLSNDDYFNIKKMQKINLT
jgi:nucleoside-diphosphate-sugar epimerase